MCFATYLCSNSQSYSLRTCKGKHGVKAIRFAEIRRTPLSLTPVAPQILGEGFFLVYWNTSLPPALKATAICQHLSRMFFDQSHNKKGVIPVLLRTAAPRQFVLLRLI